MRSAAYRSGQFEMSFCSGQPRPGLSGSCVGNGVGVLKPERVQLCQNSTLSTLAMSTKVDLWDVRFPIINDLDLYSGAVWDLLSATYSLTSYSICTLRCTRFRPRFPHCLHIRMLRCHRNPYRKSRRLGAQWFEK